MSVFVHLTWEGDFGLPGYPVYLRASPHMRAFPVSLSLLYISLLSPLCFLSLPLSPLSSPCALGSLLVLVPW